MKTKKIGFAIFGLICLGLFQTSFGIVIHANKFGPIGKGKGWCVHNRNYLQDKTCKETRIMIHCPHEPWGKNRSVSYTFDGPSCNYDISVWFEIKGNGETDYFVSVDGDKVGGGKTPGTNKCGKTTCKWVKVGSANVKKGAKLQMTAKVSQGYCKKKDGLKAHGGVYAAWSQMKLTPKGNCKDDDPKADKDKGEDNKGTACEGKKPDKISGLKAKEIQKGEFEIEWDDAECAENYEVRWKHDNKEDKATTDKTSHVIKKLETSSKYQVTVVAKNGGKSGKSKGISVTTAGGSTSIGTYGGSGNSNVSIDLVNGSEILVGLGSDETAQFSLYDRFGRLVHTIPIHGHARLQFSGALDRGIFVGVLVQGNRTILAKNIIFGVTPQ